MQRLNVRFCLLLLGCVLVVSATLTVVYFVQAGNIASALLWQAEQAQKQDRLDQAIKYLARYLEFAPQDHERRAQLGKLMADPSVAVSPRSRRKAAFVLEQVLARDPDQHEVRQQLTTLLIEAQDRDRAREHVAYLQKAQPRTGDTLELVGRLHEADGRSNDAMTTYRQALRGTTAKPDSALRLVQLLRVKHENHPAACAPEVEQVLKQVQARFPGHVAVRQARADWAIDVLDFATARQQLELALKDHPRHVRLYQTLARLEMKDNRSDDAVQALRRGLKQVAPAQQFDLNWTLGNLLIDLERLDDSRSVVAELEKASPGNPSARYLEGRTFLVQKRWFEAAAVLERLRSTFGQSGSLSQQIDLYLSVCYENLGEPARQLAACHRLLERDAQLPLGLQGAAAAALNLGRTDLALDYQKRLMQVRSERKDGKTGQLEYARMLLLGNTARDPRRWEEVENAINLAEREQPASVDVPLLRAELWLAREQPQKSEEVLRLALKFHNKDFRIWHALLVLAERGGDPARLPAVLKEAEQTAGDSAGLRLARARVLAREGANADALRQLEDNAGGFSQDDRTELLGGLAELHYRLKNTVEAERLWRQVLAAPGQEKDLRMRLLLFDLALQSGENGKVAALTGEVRKIEGPDGPVGNYCAAARLLQQARQGDRSGLGQARQLLKQLITARPNWAPPVLAFADLETIEGNTEQAIARYRQAVELGIRHPQLIRQLVELLASKGRHEEAEVEMRKVQRGGQLQGDLQKLAVALSLRRDDPGRVDELLRQNDLKNSQDYRDHLWLGQVLAAGKPASPEAEQALRTAVRLGKQAPETWIALVRYLVNANRSSDAEKEINEVAKALPPAESPLILASCWEMVGNMEQARTHYQQAEQAQPDEIKVLRVAIGFHVRQENWEPAEAGLRRIIAGRIKGQDGDLTWARQSLASVLLARGQREKLPEALALVGLHFDRQGNIVEDARSPKKPGDDLARARVLALQPRLPLATKALALLEQVNRTEQLGPDDQFLLARLYLLRARQENGELWWAKASEVLRSLLSIQGRNPAFLRFYGQSLVDFDGLREAEGIAARLEQVEKSRAVAPGNLGSIELRARLHEARKQPELAARLLEEWARRPDAPPERLLLLAALQGRQGRLKEALDLCGEAGAKLPQERALATAVEAVRAAQPRRADERGSLWTEQTQRLQGRLGELIAKEPKNLAFRLQLTDLLDLLGRHDEVEKGYREVLQVAPGHPVALNNLAWLIAQKQPARANEALKLINQAIDKLGPQPDLLDTRAVVYLALQQPQPALADLEQATREAPSPAKYFHLVQAHHLARNPQAALDALQRASAMGLQPGRLHPLERDSFQRLSAELKGGRR